MKYPLFSFRLGKLLVMILLTMLALLTLLVTLTLAIDFPPGGVTAAIQTSGPGTALGIGDWYTQGGQGNGPHRLRIFVPCTVAPGQNFTLELFDPEALAGAVAPDEIRGAADDTTFTLIAPDGTTQVATQTYPPLPATNDLFVN
ncbi:MAG TPA: hypothetical protein VEC93_08680, partial [Anaerolineae bacterium]|nr:hypothetical protein [Anaerolineae bacterium]